MRNFTKNFQEQPFSVKQHALRLCLLFVFLVIGGMQQSFAQPTVLGSSVSGTYTTYDLVTRGGGVRFVRVQATSAGTAGLRNWEFVVGSAASPNYNTLWRPYTASQQISAYNTYIDPTSILASARYNTSGSGGGASGTLPAVVSGSYYTFLVGGNSTASNFMSVLSTTYNPKNITSASQSPVAASVGVGMPVVVTTTISAALSTNETVYLRYSKDGFSTSTIIPFSTSGTTLTATIPGITNTASATVSYYIFSSNQATAPSTTQADYFTLNLYNSSGQNAAGGGTNYSYTVGATTPSYTWNQTGTASWATAANWTPSRTTLGVYDNMIFNNGATTTVTNIPAGEAIGGLTVSANTTVNLQMAATGALTVNNGISGADLSVASGSALNANGANALALTLATGATGTISGTMDFSTAVNTIVVADASGLTFNSGGSLTQNTGNTGAIFGTTGTANVVIFASGSKFEQFAGSNPFGLGQPASKVTFQTGSLFKLSVAQAPGFTGRTYANFEYNASGTTSVTGGSAVSIDNVTISQGTFNFNMTAASNIKGNISVATGATLTFTPASATAINLNGSSAQTITTTGTGVLTVGSSGTLTVGATSTVNLAPDTVISGAGAFAVTAGGTLGIGSTAGIASSGATGNVRTTTRTFNAGANYVYNGVANQITGSGLPSTVRTLTINNTGTSPTNVVTLSGITGITATASSLTLTAGKLDLNLKQLTIPTGGNVVATSGDFTSTAGPLFFVGTGTVSGTVNFPTVTVAGGVNFGSASTIVTSLQINSGGYVDTNAPFYGSNATLIYNSGATYGRGKEWSATSGAGYPNHILIGNGVDTTLDAVNASTSIKKIAGNLTVSNNSTFLVTNSVNGTGGVGTEIGGNIINDGTITLNGTTNQRLKATNFTNGNSNITATTNLSSTVGGDLELTGNYVDNATFTANSRAIFFTGTGTQTIGGTASAPFNIDYIVSTKSSGSIQLLQNLLTAAPNTGNAITLSSATDIFDLNGYTLTIGTSGLASTISGSGKFKGGSTSGLNLLGTGAFGTITFDQSTPGTTNLLNTLTLNRTTSGSATLGSHLSVSGTTTLTAGQLVLGANNLTVGASGSIAVASPDATTMIVASGAGELRKVYSGTGSFVFPIGDTTSTAEYSPVTLNFTSGSFSSAYAGVKLSNSKQSNNASATDYINRYWTVSTSGITSPVCTASFTYTDGDIAGTEANLYGGNYVSSTWNCMDAVSTATNTISATLSTFGDITAGDFVSVGCCINPTVGGTIATVQTICSGTAPAAFTNTVSPSGENGTLEYVWQSSTTSSSSGFSDIASSNTDAFTPVATITQTTWFKRLARVSCKSSWTGAAESNVIQVDVDTPTVAGTVSGGTAICSGATSDVLTLSGHTGSIVRWESSVSPFSSWTTIANTTTTHTSGALTETTRFRAVVQSGSCSEANAAYTTVTLSSTTWNGSAWSNSAPNSTTAAIIAGNYSEAANITACSLTVTSGTVVIPSGYNVTLNNALTVSGGTFTLSNNANLIQTTEDANSGSITVNRDTSMRRLDYTYWSSPVASQNLLAFSPQTLTNRFFTFNESSNLFVEVTDPSTTNFDVTKGYIIRASNFLPPNGDIVTVNSAFTGVPNNGTKTISVGYSGVDHGYNLIGNPYPSTVDAEAFLNYSGNAGTICFWTHYVQQAGASNYAYFNFSGGTAGANGITPNGTIQVGQGFIYTKTASGTATFTNAMRVGNNSNQFFRNSAPGKERHRIWLNLSSSTTTFNQTLVGYIEGATQGIDAGIDGTILETGTTISSRINNENYVIQGRALPFVATDVVPLSFNAATADSYSLSIDHVDGLFAGSQTVYLKDNLLGTTHDIKANQYTFTSDAGTFNNRFEIVYTSSPLAVHTPTFDANSVIVYKQNEAISINAGATVMASIKVFDIRGRLLFENKAVNATTTTIKNLKAEQQMLLVQITSNDASVVTKKILY